MNKKRVTFQDMSRPDDQPLITLSLEDLLTVPNLGEEAPLVPAPEKWTAGYEFCFDGHTPLGLPKPKSREEEDEFVRKFLSGLEKLLDPRNNWTFLQVLKLSLDYCMHCQTCSDACHAYLGSGKQEIYRPTFRTEVLRKIYTRYFTPQGRLLGGFVGAGLELNYKTLVRLLESAYRCTLCRRCAQTCPVGLDNGVVAREIRKLFSQELGIAPPELHDKGAVAQLKVGSSTGMNPLAFQDMIEFIEDDIFERTDRKIKIPVDKKGADILLIHNAGEYLAWPENPGAFAILFDAAGISYTLSSEAVGYDAVNYGAWYDDVELARVVLRHTLIGKKLGVKKIVIGECGHATKAYVVVADRVLTGDLSSSEIPRESCLPLLWEIVRSGAIKFDPARNNFPVTLHDPCNMVRLMGLVEPQRRVLWKLCPQFREMNPHGVYNYCCGGGSGFAIIQSFNFPQWRNKVGTRMKMKQILDAFAGELDPAVPKYVAAPCSNCKGALRDALAHYQLWDKYRILYGGVVELMVNAMADLPRPFVEWEFH
ncbi:MAG: (Fe-S)-binding protein [Bacillota bacterium]